jgi:3-hydroxyisobutyrate/3-hydroxypropionate dehydrogenase
MTSVPKAPHVKDVFLNPDTGLLAMRKIEGRKILFLELSTIDVAASTEVARAVIDGGFGDFVDAPCSVSIHSLRA